MNCSTCKFWEPKWYKCSKVEYRGNWQKEELNPDIVTCIWDTLVDLAFAPNFSCIHYESLSPRGLKKRQRRIEDANKAGREKTV